MALGVMARAPSTPGKTRLAAAIPQSQLLALRTALLADTLDTACSYTHADVVVFVTPAGTDAEILALAPRAVPVVAQRGDDLGARMRHAFEELLTERRYDAAMLVGTDAPLLNADHLAEAATLLRTRGGVVLGPSDDGGYYLIGMTQVFAPLFEGIAWGSDRVLIETMAVGERLRIDAYLIRGAYDIDTVDNLDRLKRDLASEPVAVAKNLRRVLFGAME